MEPLVLVREQLHALAATRRAAAAAAPTAPAASGAATVATGPLKGAGRVGGCQGAFEQATTPQHPLQPAPAVSLPDATLRLLEFAFAGDTATVDRALEAVDDGAVVLLVAAPHEPPAAAAAAGAAGSSRAPTVQPPTPPLAAVLRAVFQVQSSLPPSTTASHPVVSPGVSGPAAAAAAAAVQYDRARSGIDSTGYYTVVPGAFCSCADFMRRTLPADPPPVPPKAAWCKHLLAVAVADAVGAYTTRVVSADHLARVLELVGGGGA